MVENTIDLLRNLFKDSKDCVFIIDSKRRVCFLSESAKYILPRLSLNKDISDLLGDGWQNNPSVIICESKANIIPIKDKNSDDEYYVFKISDEYIPVTYEFPVLSELSRSTVVELSNRFYTPLTIIFSSLLYLNKSFQNDAMDEKSKKALSTIRQNCYFILKLLGNLSDIASIDPYDLNVDLNLKTINISDFIKKLVSSLDNFSKYLKIPIEFNTAIPGTFAPVDVKKLEKILLILLSNCFKFTRENNSINISLNETLNHIIIKVSDSGAGMSKEVINRVFTPYKSNGDTTKPGGSSLIIAKIYIEQMGGTMIIESVVDKGTKITFTISKNLSSSLNIVNLEQKSKYINQGFFAPKYIEFCDIIDYDDFLKS